MKEQNWKKSIFLFLAAQTISVFGSSLVQYAIIWYITLNTSSGKMLTIATICGFLPQIIVSLFAGIWIDRFNRKKIIMLADSIIAISTLVLALIFMAGYRNIWLLFAVLIIRSAGTGVQIPAVNAIIPQIVPQKHLMRINGINSTLSSIIMFLSPAVSGVILSFAPLEMTLLIDVFTAMIGVSITAAVCLNFTKNQTTTKCSAISELKAGFTYIQKNRFIRRILFFQLVILFLISPSAFLTPLMVSRTFGIEVWRLTLSEMTYSLGMILGGVIISLWGGFSKRLYTTMLAGAFYGVLMLGLGIAPYFSFYLVCNTLIGIMAPCYNAPITVTIQERVEQHMQGRIFSFMQIATSCALPLGMVIFGPLADVIQVQKILFGAGILVLLTIGFVFSTHYFNDHE